MDTRLKYREIVDEMRAKGMLCPSEMAERLGIEDSTLRHQRRSGHIQGVYHPEIRIYFYPADLKIVVRSSRLRRRKRRTGEGNYRRGVKATDGYRGDSVPSTGEQVRLDAEWAMWPAPGWVRFGKRSYQVSGKRNAGWLGGYA